MCFLQARLDAEYKARVEQEMKLIEEQRAKAAAAEAERRRCAAAASFRQAKQYLHSQLLSHCKSQQGSYLRLFQCQTPPSFPAVCLLVVGGCRAEEERRRQLEEERRQREEAERRERWVCVSLAQSSSVNVLDVGVRGSKGQGYGSYRRWQMP